MKIAIVAGVNLVISLVILKESILAWLNGSSFLNLQRLSDFFSSGRQFVLSELHLNVFALAALLVPILSVLTTSGSLAALVASVRGRTLNRIRLWMIIISITVAWQVLVVWSFSYRH